MDTSLLESDTSLSPSKILERLQLLRQLQLLQKGKLHKQRSEYPGSPGSSCSATEVVSRFSSSTSYNTFRSLLQSSQDTGDEDSSRPNLSGTSKLTEHDLIDGVTMLNLSQESEFIVNSPVSATSNSSASCKPEILNGHGPSNNKSDRSHHAKNYIVLDDMPILSPKHDFETLVLQKLNSDKNVNVKKIDEPKMLNMDVKSLRKKPFLKRGEGIARFGLSKNNFVIQNTKSLPWKKKDKDSTSKNVSCDSNTKINATSKGNKVVKILTPKKNCANQVIGAKQTTIRILPPTPEKEKKEINDFVDIDSSQCFIHNKNKPSVINSISKKDKHPLVANKGQTWASILTKEQDDLLRQLKQSEYYKNYASPAKSAASDLSCQDSMSKEQQEKEAIEQNMFELLERKVSHDSFSLENSFFNKFLRRSQMEYSGESTPLVMQKCLAGNPDLMHIFPGLSGNQNKFSDTNSDAETCDSEYTDCDNDTCSSVSTCCSCKTVEETNNTEQNLKKHCKDTGQNNKSKKNKVATGVEKETCHDETVTNENAVDKANMEEMNTKLLATSDLLQDRLKELEDEIETFRKENANLAKMREDVDVEKQKFFEEKAAFEQKFNEDKILSEYYLAEEKEKLAKQKQMYERYVREMRGRLNKKEKDEVVHLKKEIADLKDEIRLKDAKSSSTVARLRNQLKILEKEKKELAEEVEKCKKENRRIQHSNDITRRLTNIKYLEEINKKLNKMNTKDTLSEVHIDRDVKYKGFEIERQSRIRNTQLENKSNLKRAKSVPNLKVTSRYAKYFSQRDVASQMEGNDEKNIEYNNDNYSNNSYEHQHEIINFSNSNSLNSEDCGLNDKADDGSDNDDNYLEKIYVERFKSSSFQSNFSHSDSNIAENKDLDGYFLQKSESRTSKSKKPSSPHIQNSLSSGRNNSKSPVSYLSTKSNSRVEFDHLDFGFKSQQSSRSPVTVLSNNSSRVQRVLSDNMNSHDTLAISPEPSSSKSSLVKTSLNPTEIRKADGSKELRFPNGNVKLISADGQYSKFIYYNGDIKENFLEEGKIKYYYSETKTYHSTYPDGLEVLEFPDGQIEKRYKDGSTEIRLPNGSIRYNDPKNKHVQEEWRFPDGATLSVSATGEQRIVFANGQVEVHAKDHKRREFPDGTVKLVYNDGTAETRFASGRVRIKDKHGNVIMDSAPR